MKLRILLFLLLLSPLGLLKAANEAYSLIPKPASLIAKNGTFVFSKGCMISYPDYKGDSVRDVCQVFAETFEKATGLKLKLTQSKKAHIQLTINSSLPNEAYNLSVHTNKITIESASPVGFFYAFQTLKQLLPRNVMAETFIKQIYKIKCVEIQDVPRFGWRGFMLDEGRHFFGKEEVKRVLDVMAVYKMNRFHWHLTEDQGWRIEIKKYPKLTEIGAWRDSKTLAWGDVKTDGIRYGGFYTQDDIREIVTYARKRFIEILPEIDMPGHFQAALAAYPELSCDPENKHNVWLQQGISTDVMNVASPTALQFTKDVIDELIKLFPFGYIHLGGDECPVDKWKENSLCQALAQQLGTTNYRDLQTHFYHQIKTYVDEKPYNERRKLIFWNEVLHGNTTELDDITIMAWIGADRAALQAAERGFDNILTPQIPYYINRRQSTATTEPATQGRGTETVEAVYNYQPAKNVADSLLSYYKGVQGNFWTEWVTDNNTLEYLILPRLAAIAEAGWTPSHIRQYKDFVKRIQADTVYYDLKHYRYGKHIFVK